MQLPPFADSWSVKFECSYYVYMYVRDGLIIHVYVPLGISFFLVVCREIYDSQLYLLGRRPDNRYLCLVSSVADLDLNLVGWFKLTVTTYRYVV